MFTRSKLKNIAKKSDNKLQKEIVSVLVSRLFINRWYLKKIKLDFWDNLGLLDEITNKDYTAYYCQHRAQIKHIINIWFGWYKPYVLKHDYWKRQAVRYALRWYLYRTIEEVLEG